MSQFNTKRWTILSFHILLLCFMTSTVLFAEKPVKKKKSQEQKILERYAKKSFHALKRITKREGFYNARAALNVWKSTALEAGTFDEALYQEYRQKIYQKSISENLKWFEIFIIQKDYRDARTCLLLYKQHATEIGTFDEEKFNEMEKRLK